MKHTKITIKQSDKVKVIPTQGFVCLILSQLGTDRLLLCLQTTRTIESLTLINGEQMDKLLMLDKGQVITTQFLMQSLDSIWY